MTSRHNTRRLLAAVVANHVRRVLAPWTSQTVGLSAIEALKLARSTPYYYLERLWGVSVASLCCWAMLRLACRRAREWRPAAGEAVQELWCICATFLGLTLAEQLYTDTCIFSGEMHAVWRLATGTPAERRFVVDVAREAGWILLLHAACLAWWIWKTVVPEVDRLAKCVASGRFTRLALQGVLWGGTLHLVRHSNRYFVALEVGDMLMTIGWIVVSCIWIPTP